MDLGSLKYASNSRKNRKRLGRGKASGHGKTCGRGHKGYGSRSGSKSRAYSEGGQMPIHRRLPKRGFKNINREEYQIVNLSTLDNLGLPDINIEILAEKGIVKSVKKPVKILANGKLKKPITISANAFSQTAKEKIEAAGGKAEIV